MKKIIDQGDRLIEYNDTSEIRKAVFEKVMQFFNDTELYSGEAISQSDEGFAESPVTLSEIADDIIKFKVIYKYEI
jgi:hypothetical protein